MPQPWLFIKGYRGHDAWPGSVKPVRAVGISDLSPGAGVGSPFIMNATAHHRGIHLEQSEVMPRTDRCPICLSDAPRQQVHEIQHSPAIHLLQCENCWGCSASHMPVSGVLARLYRDYYGEGSGSKTMIPSHGRFSRHIVSHLAELRPVWGQIHIIDFGGGDGSLALHIASRLLARNLVQSVQVTAVDFHGVARSDDPRIRSSNCTELDQITDPAEIVLASAIMEHVPDCNGAFQKLFDRMVEGGYFYARTPWALPLKYLAGKIDIAYPFHVHDMGGGFWNRVPQTFRLRGKVLMSGPSPIETSWSQHPVRNFAATLLKAPARAERIFLDSAKRKDPFWEFVGGWELLFRRGAD
jgi:methyltransferase family protein